MEKAGKIVSSDFDKWNLLIRAENIKAKISLHQKDVFRINISKTESSFPDYLNVESNRIEIKLIESDSIFEIEGDLIKAQIDKNNFAIKFITKNNVIINEDHPFFSNSILNNQIFCYKKLQKNERFTGLGEKTGDLNKRGKVYVNWNKDHFGYGTESDPLYLTIPFYIGIHDHGMYGIFLNNTSRTTFDFAASNIRFACFSAECGDLDYFFIYGQSFQEILKGYYNITGYIALPPKWSLGLHQSRYGYRNSLDLEDIIKNYQDRNIPLSALHLDIHHMEEFKTFTLNGSFEKDGLENLLVNNIKVIVINDPGIKADLMYPPFKSGLDGDHFIKYPDGDIYTAEVWTGRCAFPDFTNKDTRVWWSNLCRFYFEKGVSGIWNDMNEPACWGQYIPSMIEFGCEGNTHSYLMAHNIYGSLMSQASYNAMLEFDPCKRPFILSRSGYSGIQKYAAVWTGDNTSSEEQMFLGIRLLLNLNISGIPFCGMDIGGFIGDCSTDLMIKWLQIGVFTPFFRIHSMIDSKRSEPWSYGETAEDIMRNYINFRYNLIPHIYSCFFHCTQNGKPIIQPLCYQDPLNGLSWNQFYQHEFHLGEELLIIPSPVNKDLVRVYFPTEYYDLWNDQLYAKGECIIDCNQFKLPVFVKKGSFLPLIETGNNSFISETLSIHFYPSETAFEYQFYDDDGESFNYESGEFYKRTFRFDPEFKFIFISGNSGSLANKFKFLKIYFHDYPLRRIILKDQEFFVEKCNFRFMPQIKQIDVFHSMEDKAMIINDLHCIKIDFPDDELIIQLEK